MRYIFTLLLVCFSTPVLSSTESEFSEFKTMITKRKTTSERIDLLEKADELLASDNLTDSQEAFVLHRAGLICIREGCFDKTSAYLSQLEVLLTRFDSLEYLGKLNLSRGNMANTKGNYSEAIAHLKLAAQYFDEGKEYQLSSHAHRFLSKSLFELKQYTESLVALDKASHSANLASDLQLQMAVTRQKSDIYKILGLTEKSLELQVHQLAQIKLLPNKAQEFWIRDTLVGLASNYDRLGDHQKSYEYLTRVYEIDQRLHGKQDIAKTLKELGMQSRALKKFAQAKQYFDEALSISKQFDAPINTLDIKIQMSKLAIDKGEINTAQKQLESIMSRLDEKKHVTQYLLSSFLLIEVYLKQAHFDRASVLLKQVKGLKDDDEIQYYDYLSQALSGLGDFEGAFKAQQSRYLSYKTQTEKQNDIKTLVLAAESSYLVGQYELKQAKSAQALLKAEQTITRYLGFSVVAILLIIILFVLVLTRQRRKRLEQEARHLNQALELKKQLLADVSHELRTPLAVLKLHLEALEHNLVADPQSTYKVLNQRLDNLNLLISDIYELAQADTGTFTLNLDMRDANALFDELAGQVEDVLFEHDLHLEIHKPKLENVMLAVDSARLHQVVANLSRNSIHYTNKPGEVCFEISQTKQHVMLSFSDSSPGVSDEDLPNLFDRLFRCDKSRSRDLGGSGLGLSISEKIIEAHNGKITAKHSVLGGLKIEISLPKA